MKIALASDHAGFSLKEKLVSYLKSLGGEVLDLGPVSDLTVDYPDFATKVAQSIKAGSVDRGILICGSGIGMCMAANRFSNVRAAVLRSEEDAKMSRLHNDANVACLGGRVTGESEAKKFLKVFLETPFEGGRHARRVKKIK